MSWYWRCILLSTWPLLMLALQASAHNWAAALPNVTRALLERSVLDVNSMEMVTKTKIVTFHDSKSHRFMVVQKPDACRYTYTLNQAKAFGGAHMEIVTPVELIKAVPKEACSQLVNHHELIGQIVFIARGECSFVTKALIAQSAGALGVIIYDYEESDILPDMIDDGSGRGLAITIPVYFLRSKDAICMINHSAGGDNVAGEITLYSRKSLNQLSDLPLPSPWYPRPGE